MDSTQWDARYAASDLVWSADPNTWVEQIVAGMPPGRAIDLAAGEGRNAIWLADHGWTVLAVDFSPVAVERARRLADERLADGATRLTFEVGDLLRFPPPPERFDLALVVYLHLPPTERSQALRTAAACVAPEVGSSSSATIATTSTTASGARRMRRCSSRPRTWPTTSPALA